MAEATKTTERVEKTVYEDKDFVNVKMSVDEAAAVYSALWLIEMRNMNDPNYVAIKGVQDALGVAIDYPITKLRFDMDNERNCGNSVFVVSRRS